MCWGKRAQHERESAVDRPHDWKVYHRFDPPSLGVNFPLPLIRFQNLLPQADGFWRNLDQLIFADEFDGLLQIEQSRRYQTDGFIGAGGAHVGELLFLDNVDVEVRVA